MHNEEFCEISELSKGVVSAHGRLTALETKQADAYVRLLDHRNIVRAIANGEQDRLLILLDELHNQCLLQRRYATWKEV